MQEEHADSEKSNYQTSVLKQLKNLHSETLQMQMLAWNMMKKTNNACCQMLTSQYRRIEGLTADIIRK